MESVDLVEPKGAAQWSLIGMPISERTKSDARTPFAPSTTRYGLKRKPGEKMEDKKTVKRVAARSHVEAGITCRPYASCGAIDTADGVMRNFSSQGSYIETPRKFESGTILIVRMVRYAPATPARDDASQPRTIGLAEVKWCQKLADEYACRYGMGLRYLD